MKIRKFPLLKIYKIKLNICWLLSARHLSLWKSTPHYSFLAFISIIFRPLLKPSMETCPFVTNQKKRCFFMILYQPPMTRLEGDWRGVSAMTCKFFFVFTVYLLKLWNINCKVIDHNICLRIRWLQPGSYVDPKQCLLRLDTKSLFQTLPTSVTIITRDQYGKPAYVPTLKVELTVKPHSSPYSDHQTGNVIGTH